MPTRLVQTDKHGNNQTYQINRQFWHHTEIV